MQVLLGKLVITIIGDLQEMIMIEVTHLQDHNVHKKKEEEDVVEVEAVEDSVVAVEAEAQINVLNASKLVTWLEIALIQILEIKAVEEEEVLVQEEVAVAELASNAMKKVIWLENAQIKIKEWVIVEEEEVEEVIVNAINANKKVTLQENALMIRGMVRDLTRDKEGMTVVQQEEMIMIIGIEMIIMIMIMVATDGMMQIKTKKMIIKILLEDGANDAKVMRKIIRFRLQ